MEQRLANWITYVVGGSYIAAAMLFALVWFIIAISNGDFGILLSKTTFKWFFWGSLYVFSIYLVYSLKGKGFKRRVVSWSFSILFHVSLLSYVAVALNAGFAAFVVGIPEIVIVVLSILGLGFSVWSHYQSRA